jgi:hypothetical protein
MENSNNLYVRSMKSIKNAGVNAQVFGSIFIIGGGLLYFFIPDFLSVFVVITNAIIGIVLIILGGKVRRNPSYGSIGSLYGILALSLVCFVVDYIAVGVVSMPNLLISLWAIIGISAAKKISSPEAIQAEIEQQQKNKTMSGRQKAGDFLKMILIAILVLGAFVCIDYLQYRRNVTPPLSSNPSVNAVVSRMPKDQKLRADYVIGSNLISMLTKASSYMSGNHFHYDGFCQSQVATSHLNEISTLNVGGIDGVRCTDGDFGFAVSSSFNDGTYTCYDSTGYVGRSESALHTGPLCQPLAQDAKPTWYFILPTGYPLTPGRVNSSYDNFLPLDEVGEVQVVAGQIPPGLTLKCFSGTSCDGKKFLIGAPSKEGTYTFTVAYSNGSYKLTKTFTIVITI